LNNPAILNVKNAQNSHTPNLHKTGVPSLHIKYYEFNVIEHFMLFFCQLNENIVNNPSIQMS